MEILVAHPGRPVGPFAELRRVHAPSLPPRHVRSSGLIRRPCDTPAVPCRHGLGSPHARPGARRRRLPLCRVHRDLAALGGALPRLRRVEHARPSAGTPRRIPEGAGGGPAGAAAGRRLDGRHPPVPTGVSELDRVMGGGVVAGSVTLLFGPPGIGKSTLLFQVLSSLCSHGARRHAGLGRGVAGPGAGTGVAHRPGAPAPLGPRRARRRGDRGRRRAPPPGARGRGLAAVRLRSRAGPARRQPGPGARLRRAADPHGQVERCPAAPGGPRDQGRRPGRAPGRRAPGRHRPLLRRRPPPRPPRPDLGQAPLRAGRGGRHLRDARRRPARRARPRPAPARGPHGRRSRQRRWCPSCRGAARCSSRCRRCSVPAPAAARGRRGRRPWASTRRGPTSSSPSWPAAPRSRSRRRPRCSPPPSAASRSPSRRPTWPSPWPWRRSSPTSPSPPDVVVFGELGLAGEVRTVPGADRRLAEAHRAGFTRALVPASMAGAPAAAPPGLIVHGVRTLAEALAPGHDRRPAYGVSRVRCPGGRRCRRQPASERRAGDDCAGHQAPRGPRPDTAGQARRADPGR